MTPIVVGADAGLHFLDHDGSSQREDFVGKGVTALGREGSDVWAIVDGAEIWRMSAESGWSRRADLEGVRANCIADTGAGVLIGTSEAHLVRLAEGRPERIVAFDRVEARDRWYTPWGGPPDVRSISEDDDAVYVNVHVGGIVRTTDGGSTWTPTIDIDADVHKVWAGRGSVFAACARGLAVSDDAGASWTIRHEGLHATYCRAVTVCGDTLLVSASTGPRGGRAAVYRTSVSVGPFERCRQGLPEWFDGNIDSLCLDADPDAGVAAFGTDDGRVFASTDEGATWKELAAGLAPVRSVLVMP